MTFTIQKKVLRLQVSVDNGLGVEIIQSRDYLWRVEVTGRIVKSARITKVGKEFASTDKLQQHIEEPVVMMGPQPERGQRPEEKRREI